MSGAETSGRVGPERKLVVNPNPLRVTKYLRCRKCGRLWGMKGDCVCLDPDLPDDEEPLTDEQRLIEIEALCDVDFDMPMTRWLIDRVRALTAERDVLLSRTGQGDEGCVCGHGQYQHGGGKLYGEHSRCSRCGCQEFRRPQSGRMPSPLVECSGCGRRLTPTTSGAYGVRIRGREHRYHQVRRHNTPAGVRCLSDHTTPVPYIATAAPYPSVPEA